MELLSPAGNFQGFIGALNAGCDAVYLGGRSFGARAYADNFSDEEIIQAIKIAHIKNVRVYLTVNTLIKEREFEDVIKYIKLFYENGLDGCIVQDIGLISQFHKLFPGLECHISTQGYSTSKESVKLYKEMGAKRVVLARELSFEEIKDIKDNVDIEIETFIHGAMCYSYSGECLFSSSIGGRSGNRGRCAGPCRLPYRYIDENSNEGKESYFLSMKDQCTLLLLPKLIENKIDSLKIEGRMKSPEYTAFVTSIYRKYIDLYESNPSSYKVDPKDIEALKHVYLRSEISEGYYLKKNGRDMISLNNPGYSGNDDSIISETKDKLLDAVKKEPINLYFYARVGERAFLSATYKDITVTKEGFVVDMAQKTASTEADVKKQIEKLGDTVFLSTDAVIDIDDNSFLPVKLLNELRRDVISLLSDEILSQYNSLKLNNKSSFDKKRDIRNKIDFNDLILVSTIDQYKSVLEISDAKICIDYSLLNKIEDCSNLLISLPDVIRLKDFNFIKDIISSSVKKNVSGFYVRNYEELNILNEMKYEGLIISGPELYAFNKFSKDYLLSKTDRFVYPYELTKHEIKDLDYKDGFLCVYGKVPLMHTSNCVVKTNAGCNKQKDLGFSYIKDRTNAKMCVIRDCNICSNIIYNSVPICLFDEKILNEYKYHLLSFSDETGSETKDIIKKYLSQEMIEGSHTKAYFNRGVM